MSEIENIALFDLDSTLCDYSKALRRDYNLIKSPNDPEFNDFQDELPEYIKNRKRMITGQSGWWENLEKFNLGFDILRIAEELEFEIYILTKAPKHNPMAWTEKAKWAQEHVPKAKIILTEDKGLVYGKVLVDDFPPYIERWTENRPRGLVIMPAHPWNEDFSHKNTIRYDGTNLEQIRTAMEIAQRRQPTHPLELDDI
jgi:5'-nucleotidase